MIPTASDSRQLCRELHDRVLQPLAAAQRQLELHDVHRGADGTCAQGHVASAERALHEALIELRDIIAGTGSDGRAPDLFCMLREFLDSPLIGDVDTRLHVRGDLSSAPPTLHAESFLILREAICNALEHGGASSIIVRVATAAKALRASVEDDGSGFDLDAATPGMGLASMCERAARLGGAVSLTTVPGGSTRVELVVPLAGQAG